MGCPQVRDWILRSLDGELSADEHEQLNVHLGRCLTCERERKFLSLPRSIGKAIPVLEPSPYFYQRLRAHIRSESETVTIWQILLSLSRQVVPTLAVITLLLLSIFAYQQVREPQVDVYQAYDRIFTRGDFPRRMVIAEQDEITEESVLMAIAGEETDLEQRPNSGSSPRR